ncbi:hypothetical protein GUITHDRAFT_100970 [Guillardia theta CCMP2712]|uniref:Nop domain-containing protein n=1 Tax=Guillardia theta (strain CCMP2712) TaxID=905079 RepID=L1JY65_GUITC|nr:hypothetical protein GUITHDRAFT_100970 [Guillardia theta CCMP2712]EKX53264.1 hypothetical protein GUITHDRAFT_100970 [Guillardia theta CCMP2712]|eukprot:XP_005840244.1 hypothetical protein GUITHDRAFT_100970 [Guillardia theta CCMP2712]
MVESSRYLADLDGLDDSAGEEEVAADGNSEEEMDQDKEFDEDAAEMDATKELSALTRLYGSENLRQHMERIKQSLNRSTPAPYTPEYREDYELVCKSNEIVYELEQETFALTTYIRQGYAIRFPELEALIQNNLDYVRTVYKLGNIPGGDATQVDLSGVLPSATIMVVTVTATTTSGKELPQDQLEKVMTACEQTLKLEENRLEILDFIESRMNILAPNLTIIVGSKVAATMMAMAGGLQELSRMPSCNIRIMGAKRKVQNGMSTAALGVRGGIIVQSPLVLNSPQEFREKAVKLISAKCALAARVDASIESPSGEVGKKLKDQIEESLAKVAEPPPQKRHKALPVPDEKPKKRRGGKRARAIKEKYATTELMKQANRMQFGVQEEEVFGGTDETMGLGSLGKLAHSGKLRIQKKEVKLLNQKARERNGLTSAVKGMVFQAMASDGTGTVTPLASSKAFMNKAASKYFEGQDFFKKSGKDDKELMPPPLPKKK